MKRCPKCNRSFPEESQKFCTVDGGLLIAEPSFDPNATMRATSAELGLPTETLSSQAATSRKLPQMADTIFAPAPTSKPPIDEGAPTSSPSIPQQQQAAAAPAPTTGSLPPAKKKSKLPLILGILAVLLILGIGGIAAAFFFVIKPRLDQMQERPIVVRETPSPEITPNTEAPTPSPETKTPVDDYQPPADATKFQNSNAQLDGRLAEHYVDFSFYYPKGWQPDPKAGVAGATNFVKVERRLPPDFTQENFAVGWYTSQGTFAADTPLFPRLVELLSANLSKDFPGYRKVSEGPTKINSMDAYEFRFVSLSKGTEKGDIEVWGRVVFLPSGTTGQTTGATLIMLATSLAPELSGIDDVGDKGEMPVILESFRFAKK
ncbi:MAG TPA: hypothetical protein VJS64_15830 [Pyrinomonadaceae bacterium]|nr:hypothetical protein [Pyrinomonadaceae bacterium]